MNYKTIKEAAMDYCSETDGYKFIARSPFKSFEAGVEYATTWNKIDVTDVKTFPDENEPVLVKDGDWLFVGVRNRCIFVTDVESVEITNDIEWRLINFK